MFGTALDDDIVSTAGRLADAEVREGKPSPRLEVVFVTEVPLTVPLDAPLPKDVVEAGDADAGARGEVADEYENVDVGERLVPAAPSAPASSRRRGGDAERRDGGRAAEPGARGAILGGIGAARPDRSGR